MRGAPTPETLTRCSAHGSAPRSCSPAPCSRGSGRCDCRRPGGDVIGRRRVDTHFLALERLGAVVTVGATFDFEAQAARRRRHLPRRGQRHRHRERPHGGRGGEGRTVLRNAASEPHVQDLARLLVAMGAHIEGIGSNIMTIEGGRPLQGTEFTIGPDHIEIGSFIGLAAVTNGDYHRGGAAPRPARHAPRLRAAGHLARIDGDDSSSTATRSGGSARTWAATSPSSRTLSGRPSRPTSCPSPSSPRPSARA